MSTVTEPTTVATQVVETSTEHPDPVDALKVTETPEVPAIPQESAVEVPPQPTPSKSNPTKRLSIFLGKAKSYVDKKVHDIKPTSPKATEPTPVEATEPTTTEPVVEPSVETAVEPTPAPVVEATAEPVAEPTTAEPTAEPVEEVKPKSEKRKSILAGIFRSKSPVPKEAEATPAAEVKPDDTVTDKEVQETPVAATAADAAVEEEPVVEQHHEKENVIDQIKRSPLGKFFNKKKEVEHKEEESTAAVVEEPTTAVVVEEPAVVEAPVQPEEKPASRPGSPLGRRITQMFRGFSSKKKVPTVEDAKVEEDVVTAVEPAATTADEPVTTSESVAAAEPVAAIEPTATIENTAVEILAAQEEHSVIPSKLPTIQSSA